MTTIFDVIGNPEHAVVRDWRELISRVADHCIEQAYADHGPGKERHWRAHYTRRVRRSSSILESVREAATWLSGRLSRFQGSSRRLVLRTRWRRHHCRAITRLNGVEVGQLNWRERSATRCCSFRFPSPSRCLTHCWCFS